MAPLENEHDSFREVHLSLVYEVSWHFVHSFISYSRLSGAIFAFVLYHHDNAPSLTFTKVMAKLDQLWFELVAHPSYSPDPQRLLSVPKPRAVAFQGKRFTLNEKIIAETEAYFEGLDVSYYKKDIEMLKIAISSVSPSKATMLSCMNKYNFAQKCLFSLKIPGLFSPCSIWKDIAYISLWLALMQKFVQERKVIRDKCSQCADIGSGISLFKYACGVGKQRLWNLSL